MVVNFCYLFPETCATARHEGPPHILRLTPEALAAFDVLRADLESRIGEGGDLRPVCGYASKLPGVVARIALALLVEGEWLRPVVALDGDTRTGRPPSPRYAVNPAALDG